jgi:hypothetical protein
MLPQGSSGTHNPKPPPASCKRQKALHRLLHPRPQAGLGNTLPGPDLSDLVEVQQWQGAAGGLLQTTVGIAIQLREQFWNIETGRLATLNRTRPAPGSTSANSSSFSRRDSPGFEALHCALRGHGLRRTHPHVRFPNQVGSRSVPAICSRTDRRPVATHAR